VGWAGLESGEKGMLFGGICERSEKQFDWDFVYRFGVGREGGVPRLHVRLWTERKIMCWRIGTSGPEEMEKELVTVD
jgi:hypothetical protein